MAPLWPLAASLVWASGPAGPAAAHAGCPPPLDLVESRLSAAGAPQDLQAWWRAVSDGSRLILESTDSESGLQALLVVCMEDLSEHRAEGNEQWLLVVRREGDSLQLVSSTRIGWFYCCGGSWLHQPTIAWMDADQEGAKEVLLSGRYERGSDMYQLEGEIDLYVFASGGSGAPSERGCWYPPPGMGLGDGTVPVLRNATYHYFGIPRLDLAPVNLVRSKLTAAGKNLMRWEQSWRVPSDPAEIDRWYESGSLDDLTKFEDKRRVQLIWHDPHRQRLAIACPSWSHSVEIVRNGATRLTVRQQGWDVWALEFDDAVVSVQRNAARPLAVVFTSAKPPASGDAGAARVGTAHLVNLWSGEEIWIPATGAAPRERWSAVWSPEGDYLLVPRGDTGGFLLFDSDELLDEYGLLKVDWYANYLDRLSPESIPNAPSGSELYCGVWREEALVECALRFGDREWTYRYDVRRRRWDGPGAGNL
ncbi:MAG: hypothetical protein KatS3mg081_1807 [Gemmatimonadales bacterium]|nr:MAG: hypothetical protein KatS3mg081_1807 [Gemmatimonadales bacterium]